MKSKTIIMTDPVLCCDLYPYGSLQRVTEREDGFLGVDGRNDVIPPDYPFDILPKIIHDICLMKICHSCKNTFLDNFKFKNISKSPMLSLTKFVCPRCYERHTKIDR